VVNERSRKMQEGGFILAMAMLLIADLARSYPSRELSAKQSEQVASHRRWRYLRRTQQGLGIVDRCEDEVKVVKSARRSVIFALVRTSASAMAFVRGNVTWRSLCQLTNQRNVNFIQTSPLCSLMNFSQTQLWKQTCSPPTRMPDGLVLVVV